MPFFCFKTCRRNNVGRNMMACAKMIGITPALFTFKRQEIVLHHQTACCQQSAWHNSPELFVHPVSIQYNPRMIATRIAISITNIKIPPPARGRFCSKFLYNDCGKRPRIPIMMMIEVPLPKPLSVIFSPIHITNKVPAVRTITVDNQK